MNTKLEVKWVCATVAGSLALLIAGCDRPAATEDIAKSQSTLGSNSNDGFLTSAVKSALMADPTVKIADLNVETRKGDVQLGGIVDNQQQLDRATVVARTVNGVISVENKLVLKGTTLPPIVDLASAADIDVTARVKTALQKDAATKSVDVAVATLKGDVRLSGTLDNQVQIDDVVRLARGVDGVQSIHDELSIKK